MVIQEPKFSSNPPEIWPILEKRYRVPWGPGFAVTWNGTIHSFKLSDLQPDVIEHEKVHIKQQAEYPGGPMAYLERYMNDEEFRYKNELEAFKRQYEFIVEGENDRNVLARALHNIAKDLAHPLYQFTDVTIVSAKRDILK